MTKPDTPTPAASGAAPADMRESLKWCAAALQAIGKAWAEHESSRFELVDTKESKSLSEILDEADAALAYREASSATLTADDKALLWNTHCLLENLLQDDRPVVNIPPAWAAELQALADRCCIAFKRNPDAALASPQVAPESDPQLWNVVNELREKGLGDMADRLELSSQAFVEDVYEQCAEAIRPLVDRGLLPGSVVESVQMMASSLAAPVQVAPAPEPVAWMMKWPNHSPSFTTDKSDYVSWFAGKASYPENLVPLYPAAPVQVAPVLTQDQIEDSVASALNDYEAEKIGLLGVYDRISSLAAAVQVAPAGFKLVPIEPTAEMMAAAWDHTPLHMYDMTDGDFGQAYKDMLAAAPMPTLAAADDARDAPTERQLLALVADNPDSFGAGAARSAAIARGRERYAAFLAAAPTPAAKPAEEQGS